MAVIIYIIGIIIQVLVCFFMYIPIGMFFDWIFRYGKPKDFNISEILKENILISKSCFFSGLLLLAITVVINMYFMLLIGFYLFSLLILYMGLNAVTGVYPKGKKIFDNCWVGPCLRDAFIVTLNDHKMFIGGEMMTGKYDHVVYKEVLPKWLPPHERDRVSDENYEYMLQAILKYLASHKRLGVIQEPGAKPYITKENAINKFRKMGLNVNAAADGSIKVTAPERITMFTIIKDFLFQKRFKNFY